MRRNWNWFHHLPEVDMQRYTATFPKHGSLSENAHKHDGGNKAGVKPKVKRLGSIQYRRSNMSQGQWIWLVNYWQEKNAKFLWNMVKNFIKYVIFLQFCNQFLDIFVR